MDRRIDQHFEGKGSAVTQRYTPVYIEETFEGDQFDEEKETLKQMYYHGYDKVRGGSFSTIRLSDFDKQRAMTALRSIRGGCFYCGEYNHYASACDQNPKNKKPKDQ